MIASQPPNAIAKLKSTSRENNMVLGDEFLFNITTFGPILREARETGWVSPLFPMVWLALPMFWVGAIIVRLLEGPVRQKFNLEEALHSFRNQLMLGVMWSFGPLCKWFIDENKTDMTFEEWVWKSTVAALVVDAAFYWVHRAMHDIPSLRFMHAKHHALLAKHTVWGGIDEDPLEVLTMFAYINLPFLFISVMPEYLMLFIGVGSIQTALMHGSTAGGWWLPPWPLVGALTHHGHHQTITKNYTGVFVFWDHIMGTHKRVEADGVKKRG